MRERHAPRMLVTGGASWKMTSRGKLRIYQTIGILSPALLLFFVPFVLVLCPSSPGRLGNNLMFNVTCNATTHPSQKNENDGGAQGMRREVWVWGRNTSENHISKKLQPSTKKPSIPFRFLICGIKLLIFTVDTHSLEDIVGLLKAGSLSSVCIVCTQLLSGSNWSRIPTWIRFGNGHRNKLSKSPGKKMNRIDTNFREADPKPYG